MKRKAPIVYVLVAEASFDAHGEQILPSENLSVHRTKAGAKAALDDRLREGGLRKRYEYTIEEHEVSI